MFKKNPKAKSKDKSKSKRTQTGSKKPSRAASRHASSRPTSEHTPKSSISSPIALQTTNLDAYSRGGGLEPASPFKDPRPAPPAPDGTAFTFSEEIVVEKDDDSPMRDHPKICTGVEERPETPAGSIGSGTTSTTTHVAQTAIMAKRVAAPNLIVTAPTSVPADFAPEHLQKKKYDPNRASHGTFYEAETPDISSVDVSRFPIESLPPPTPPTMSATSGPMGEMFPAGTPRSITPLSTISAR